jgi:hypothetical protein
MSDEKRKRGTPRTRWMDIIKEATGLDYATTGKTNKRQKRVKEFKGHGGHQRSDPT